MSSSGRQRETPETIGAGDSGEAMAALAAEGLIRIGELARLTGKSVRALHLYEELGLLHPEHRSPGGFRLYHPSSSGRVNWISKLQDAGFSLSDLKDLLKGVELEAVAPEAMRRVRGVFEQKLAETRAARARLAKLEKDLAESLAYLEGCRTCAPATTPAECPGCSHNGHSHDDQPLLVAGLHSS
jgi:DNA-binding transcriptional MerR regulator